MTNIYMTPKQWGVLRALVNLVRENALRCCNVSLFARAHNFLTETEGYDV